MVSLFWWQCHRDTVIQCSAEQDNFSKATSSDNLSPIKSINYTSYGNTSIYLRNYESKSENCSWFRYGISCRMRSFAFGSNVVFRKWLRPATGSLSSRLVTSIKLIIQVIKFEGCNMIKSTKTLPEDLNAIACQSFESPTPKILLCFPYMNAKICYTWVIAYNL